MGAIFAYIFALDSFFVFYFKRTDFSPITHLSEVAQKYYGMSDQAAILSLAVSIAPTLSRTRIPHNSNNIRFCCRFLQQNDIGRYF